MVVHWHSVQRASGFAAKHQHETDGNTCIQLYAGGIVDCVEKWLSQSSSFAEPSLRLSHDWCGIFGKNVKGKNTATLTSMF